MRYLQIFLIFLFPVCAGLYGQSSKCRLTVVLEELNNPEGFSYWSSIALKGKDTSLTLPIKINPAMAVSYLGSDAADSISAKRKSYSRFIFNAIPKGWYRLEIHSVFGHNFHHKVLIEEKEKEVKLDGPSHYYKTIRNANFLNEKLKIGDTLFILFTPSEMMAQKEKIAVVKLKAGLKAIQYEGSSDKVFQDMLSDNSKINLVANAEMEMRLQSKPNPAASPAVEYYTFELNKELETFTLPKGFHGMDKIKAVLFIIENK